MKNKAKVMRNILIGMLGAAMCMIAAWLSMGYGEDNVTNGFIQSNWAKMPYLRFEAAIVIYAIGIPVCFIGLRYLAKVVRLSRRKRSIQDLRMAKLFEASVNIGAVGFLFVHACYIMMAIVYKLLFTTNLMGADIISTTEGMFFYMAIPVLAFYIVAIGGSSISFMYFILQERIRVSKICLLFNPLVFVIIGELLKLLKLYYISDFVAASSAFGYLMMLQTGLVHVTKLRSVSRRREVEN